MSKLVPPTSFGCVEPQVYRSNAFQSINYPFLESLKLKTVVHLSPDMHINAFHFMQSKGIQLIHLGLKEWHPDADHRSKPLGEELVKEALETILNTDFYPVLLVCTSGLHQTGTLVGCLRRLQRWSLSSILDEYRTYAGKVQTRCVNEQFFELFDTDLVTLPMESKLPHWFKVQRSIMEQEREGKGKGGSSLSMSKLVSDHCVYSKKKSIVEDDD